MPRRLFLFVAAALFALGFGAAQADGPGGPSFPVFPSSVADPRQLANVDLTGATDTTTALQAAVNTGLHVKLPCGTYQVSQITIANGNWLSAEYGSGIWPGAACVTILGNNPTLSPLYVLPGASAYFIGDLVVDHQLTTTPSAGAGVQVGAGGAGRLARITVQDNFRGFDLGGTTDSYGDDLVAQSNFSDGFRVSNTSGVIAMQWQLLRPLSQENNGLGFNIYTNSGSTSTDPFLISPNTYLNGLGGIEFNGAASTYHNDAQITAPNLSTDNGPELDWENPGVNNLVTQIFAELAGTSPAGRQEAIVSGTYNNSTGAVSIVTGPAHGLSGGSTFYLWGLGGTGAYASLDGPFTANAGTSGTTLNFTASSGLGATTLTTGLVAAVAPANTGQGILIENGGQSTLSSILINGGSISQNSQQGILRASSSALQSLTITGLNKIWDNGAASAGTYNGIELDGGTNTLANNRSQNVLTSNQAYGFGSTAGTNYGDNNDFTGNATGGCQAALIGLTNHGTGCNSPFPESVLFQTALPFIIPPSGTMNNNGAFTLGTSLPYTYSGGAYCYFAAGQIASGSTAGWYYCAFSSATAGTVYNNAYTSGQPTIPGSPAAFSTTGPGAFTGTTSAQSGQSYSVAGGTLGIRDSLRITAKFSVPANSDTKTLEISFGGTNFWTLSAASTSTSVTPLATITNRESQSAQLGTSNVGAGLGAGTNVPPYVVGTVNTASAQTAALTGQHNTATDYVVIEGMTVELLKGQ